MSIPRLKIHQEKREEWLHITLMRIGLLIFFPHFLINCEYWARIDAFGTILNRNIIKIVGRN